MAAPEVTIARFDRSVVIFYIKLSLPVESGYMAVTVAMTCPLSGASFFEARSKLEEVLTSDDPVALEACTDLLFSGAGDSVAVQHGSFNTIGRSYELTGGLRVLVPRALWKRAMAAARQALNAAPVPLV